MILLLLPDYPLATNCSIHDGNTTVRVPKDDKFKPANNWVIVREWHVL